MKRLTPKFLESLTVQGEVFEESVFLRQHPLFQRTNIFGCKFSKPDKNACLTVQVFDDSNRILFKNSYNNGVSIEGNYLTS